MLTHIDSKRRPGMVDVADKPVTERRATARATVLLPPEAARQAEDGEIRSHKGPVFQTAIIAGTQAAKRTHELIPFCHPLRLQGCRIGLDLEGNEIVIECAVKVIGRTGAEMEALTGATVAALTVYDMLKSVSHGIVIREARLIAKTGGKSDYADGRGGESDYADGRAGESGRADGDGGEGGCADGRAGKSGSADGRTAESGSADGNAGESGSADGRAG